MLTRMPTPPLKTICKNKLKYEERIALCKNKTAKKLLSIIAQKTTNLAVSADVTTKKELLVLIDAVGPFICMLKTHIDIIIDFDVDLIMQLKERAQRYNFLLFEDRKFADIGNTVKHQYENGIYKIVDWADIINAHTLPGPGIIRGLQEAGLPKQRGLLLIAQMSSENNMCTKEYTQNTVELSQCYDDFVIGFIAREQLTSDPKFIHFTPGVKLAPGFDKLGQQYLTPEIVVHQRGCDVIIVGRGIYQHEDPALIAQHYRDVAWTAYEKRMRSNIEEKQ